MLIDLDRVRFEFASSIGKIQHNPETLRINDAYEGL